MIGGSGTTAWLDLRDAALAATRRGWPVVPGTFLGTDRRWHGRQDARGLCPVEDTWRQRPVTDPAQAWEIWTEAPYGVLLVCGRPVTALELPCAMIGLLPARGELVVPIVVTSRTRWGGGGERPRQRRQTSSGATVPSSGELAHTHSDLDSNVDGAHR